MESYLLEDDVTILMETDHSCTDCREELCVGYRLPPPSPTTSEGKLLGEFLNAEGEYAYAPYFFHDHCWADTEELLCEQLEEADAQESKAIPDAQAEAVCSVCNSNIMAGEPVGTVMMGTLTRSPREPNGQMSVNFDP